MTMSAKQPPSSSTREMLPERGVEVLEQRQGLARAFRARAVGLRELLFERADLLTQREVLGADRLQRCPFCTHLVSAAGLARLPDV